MEKLYRHEYKYIIADTDVTILKERLKALMQLDDHTSQNASYRISSLYFDDYRNSCFYDNEDGIDPREKYRIRIYNGNSEFISLECKRKERGKTLKESCVISEQICRSLIENGDFSMSEMPSLAKKIQLKRLQELLHPVVIVDYERVPFIYKTGNVRITIDQKISSSSEVKKFLSGDYKKRPIIRSGYSILEVKWDELIPDFIFQACQLDGLVQTTCSKYYLCRKYHM